MKFKVGDKVVLVDERMEAYTNLGLAYGDRGEVLGVAIAMLYVYFDKWCTIIPHKFACVDDRIARFGRPCYAIFADKFVLYEPKCIFDKGGGEP